MKTENGKTPRGYRNNNPCNIRHNGIAYVGEVPREQCTDKSFKQFKSMALGYRAVFMILKVYVSRYGLRTVREWINRWAPESDGNYTKEYIRQVCSRAGIAPDDPVDLADSALMTRIAAAMAFVENGAPANVNEVIEGYNMLFKQGLAK